MIMRNILDATVLIPMSSLLPKLAKYPSSFYRYFGLLYATCYAIFSSILLLLLAILINNLGSYTWVGPIALTLGIANFFTNIADFIRRYFIVTEGAFHGFLLDLTRMVVQILLLFSFLFFSHDFLGVNNALVILAIANFAGIAIGFKLYGPIQKKKRYNKLMWANHLTFAKWMLPSAAFESIMGSGPLIIAGGVLGDAALGLIRSVQQVANILNLPINTLQHILPSMASRRYVESGIISLRRFILFAAVFGSVMVGFGAIILLLLSDLIFKGWMTVNDPNAVFLLCAFGGLACFVLLRRVFAVYFFALEDSRSVTIANVFGAASSLSFTIIFVHTAGHFSVPLGLMTGSAVSLLILCGLVYRYRYK